MPLRKIAFLVICLGSPACFAEKSLQPVPPALAEPASASMGAPDLVEVWVVLSEPALATLSPAAVEQREALRLRILGQQNDMMKQLVALGAIESGRTQQVSNALAITIPAAAIQSVRKLSGVTSVRRVNHRNRIGPQRGAE